MHPSAVIQVITSLERSCPDAQLWIATHSMPILAKLDPNYLWCMSDGDVFFGGNRTQEILLSILGGPENIDKVAQFLRRPSEVAVVTFAAECLNPPSPICTQEEDPQLQQIERAIFPDGVQRLDLRILDWGAGLCRLAVALGEKAPSISYYAYEPDISLKNNGVDIIETFYSNPEDRWFSKLSDLCASFRSEPVDVVVMCNVLHEINPHEWRTNFQTMADILSDTGFLLVIEDLFMPHGELAHKHGFVLLDHTAMRCLFCQSDSNIIVAKSHHDARFNSRLWAYRIPKAELRKVTSKSVVNALDWITKQARRQIDEIRQSNNHSFKSGRELALHLVQYANSSICAEELR